MKREVRDKTEDLRTRANRLRELNYIEDMDYETCRKLQETQIEIYWISVFVFSIAAVLLLLPFCIETSPGISELKNRVDNLEAENTLLKEQVVGLYDYVYADNLEE